VPFHMRLENEFVHPDDTMRTDTPRRSPETVPCTTEWLSRQSATKLSGQPAGFWQKLATTNLTKQPSKNLQQNGMFARLGAVPWPAADVEAPLKLEQTLLSVRARCRLGEAVRAHHSGLLKVWVATRSPP
jgi:hypothetical protein